MRKPSGQPGVTDRRIDWLTVVLAVYSLVSIAAVIRLTKW
jgi:hypothetical protein